MYVELPEDLLAELKKFVDVAGTSLAFEVRDAIRRHLAYPPDRKPDPLPNAAKGKKKGG